VVERLGVLQIIRGNQHATKMKLRRGKLDKGPFGCADKPAEKYCWLICCERKILFRLKKQAEKDGL
jgi:hypothetical protein